MGRQLQKFSTVPSDDATIHDVVDEDQWLVRSLLRLLVSDCLGEGCYRRTYLLRGDPRHVVKLEYASSPRFHNALEWEVWSEVKGTEWEPWFCPCVRIDAMGKALLMRRARPLTDRQWENFKSFPTFFQDIKRDNFGWLDGRVVCVDYANNTVMARGFTRVRMVERKGEWMS